MTDAAAGSPPKLNLCEEKIRPRLLVALGVGFLVLDRLLKAAVLALPEPLGWTDRAEFTLFRNQGIAFSLPLPNAVFWPLALAAFSTLLFFLVRSFRGGRNGMAAILAFILLGAVSNLADRLIYGATIDYFLFFGMSAVNFADGLIVLGTLMLLFCSRRPA